MISTTIPSTVDLVIPTENIQAVVTLLISNKIAFTMTSPSHTAPPTQISESFLKAPESPEVDSAYIPLNPLSPKAPLLESICLKYIKQNIAQLPPNDAQIAAEFGMSIGSFKNGFKSVYGKTFYQLYMEKKMDYAKKLLSQGKSATEVSQQIGYSQPIKFNKTFQKHVGTTPKKYQRSHIETLQPRKVNSQPKINGQAEVK